MTPNQLPSAMPEDRTRLLFWLFAGLHLVLWTVVPTLTQPNAPLDTIEMLYWGHEWQLGYYKHPPLPGWIAEFSCLLLGRAAWPTYLAAQVGVVTCFWAAWQLARDFMKPWHALAAVLILEASYYYNYTTPELNNNVVSRALWALSVLFFYRAVSQKKPQWWILTGVSLAVGMMSRYDTAVLGATMVGFLVIHPQARQHWRSSGPYWTMATCLAALAPHLYWLVSSDFPTIRYFLDRSESTGSWVDHFVNPAKFLLSQLGAVVPIALLATPLVASWKPRQFKEPADRFQRDFLISIVLGPVAFICCASLLAGFAIRSMWGTALWTFTGVLVLFMFRLKEDRQAWRRLASLSVTATILLASVLAIRNIGSPHLRDKGSRVHFPGQQLATEVENRWNQQHETPLEIVGGTWWVAGNVAFYAEHRASVFADMDLSKSPWLNDQKLREKGGVVLWPTGSAGEAIQETLLERFPETETQQPIVLAWQTKAELSPVQIGMAIIPPAGETQKLSRRTTR